MTIAEIREFLIRHLEGSPFAGNTYIVGGAVRDHLLGVSDIWDFDLTVELPEGGIKLGKWLRGHTDHWDHNRVNKTFGTVHLNYGDFCLDLNGTRSERYNQKSRFPVISHADLMADVMRRDFTINSLLIEVFSGDLIDLSGQGLEDLERGIIRTLRDPQIVLTEDPLRILRAVRFTARFGFRFSDDLAAALHKFASLLRKVSLDRQKLELLMMHKDGHLDLAKQIMHEYGINDFLKEKPTKYHKQRRLNDISQ
jgi:poly(A) polymerase